MSKTVINVGAYNLESTQSLETIVGLIETVSKSNKNLLALANNLIVESKGNIGLYGGVNDYTNKIEILSPYGARQFSFNLHGKGASGYLISKLHNVTLAKLKSFANPTTAIVADLKAKTGKLLRFKYNGGSVAGQIRIVKLDDVLESSGGVSLRGKDLAADGIRTFSFDKIDGSTIEVLN